MDNMRCSVTFTVRERILNLLLLSNETYTASQIKWCLDGTDQPAKLSTISSTLKKMYDEGWLNRVENYGPRGGYGYNLKTR